MHGEINSNPTTYKFVCRQQKAVSEVGTFTKQKPKAFSPSLDPRRNKTLCNVRGSLDGCKVFRTKGRASKNKEYAKFTKNRRSANAKVKICPKMSAFDQN